MFPEKDTENRNFPFEILSTLFLARKRTSIDTNTLRSTRDEMQNYVRRAATSLGRSFVNNFPRAYVAAASGESSVPLISTAVGSRTTSLAECFQRLSQINAEIKESRQLRLGGKEVKMFLTVGATEADLKKALDSMEFSYVEVEKARDTMQDIKGPYCETSPLLPFFRRIQLRAPYTKAIEMKITDLMCKQGVTISHLDQYRSGKDIIMEGIAHMPTGVAEFPKLDEAIFVQNLEKEGIMVKEFSKIVGNPVNK